MADTEMCSFRCNSMQSAMFGGLHVVRAAHEVPALLTNELASKRGEAGVAIGAKQHWLFGPGGRVFRMIHQFQSSDSEKPLPAEPKPAPKPELVTRTSPEAVLLFLKHATLEGEWGLDHLTRILGVNRDTAKQLADEVARVGHAQHGSE